MADSASDPWAGVRINNTGRYRGLLHRVRFLAETNPGFRPMFLALVLGLYRIPLKSYVAIVLTVSLGGWFLRSLQTREARRRLPPGPAFLFRITGAEIEALPFEWRPRLSTWRECVAVPVEGAIELSAIGRRPLLCTLPLETWSCSLEVDGGGRVQAISFMKGESLVLRRLALGRVPMAVVEREP